MAESKVSGDGSFDNGESVGQVCPWVQCAADVAGGCRGGSDKSGARTSEIGRKLQWGAADAAVSVGRGVGQWGMRGDKDGGCGWHAGEHSAPPYSASEPPYQSRRIRIRRA